MNVFLDDDRNAAENGWTHVRNGNALLRLVDDHNADIEAISFDNDLQDPVEGWMTLRDIIDRMIKEPAYLPRLHLVIVHTANGQAACNMLSRMQSAINNNNLDVTYIHRPVASHYPLAAEDPRQIDVWH